jgi:predicted nucleic acid-binding protein
MAVTKIIDTSALAALLFGEPEGDEAAARLVDCELAAPPLLQFELANVCLIKCRRYPEQRDRLLAAFDLRKRLGIRAVEVNHGEVVLLAERTGLTAYDASYLWLARVLDAEIVTFDRKLQQAAVTAGRR